MGCLPGGVAGVIDRGGPLLNPLSALRVEDAGGTNRVGAEDLRQGLLALRIGQVAELLAQLPGQAGEPDEFSLSIIGVYAQLLHEPRRFFRRVREVLQHALERGSCVGAQ